MNCAIYYHPEAYNTLGPKLMGRNAAGESFLRAFIHYSQSNQFWVQVENSNHANNFQKKMIDLGRFESLSIIDQKSLSALSEPGVVFHPGPNICEPAFHRGILRGSDSWSLCGITHTTASAHVMDIVSNFLTSPIQPWDALICTSKAVKSNVELILQSQVDYLKERLGISKLVLPQLPVIPLGVHCSDFEYSLDDKEYARRKLELNSGSIVVLYLGRLSFHAKAHPLAMYKALEDAASQTKQDIVLVECGWHSNDSICEAFSDAASVVCPSIRKIVLDGRNVESRKIAWSIADIFCSLSDNIQETFGITPVEAMAAGIPVVVSDWDGYRDTVRDGIDGFLIPTLMPENGLGMDLALRHALRIDTYDMYCGNTSSFTSVDIKTTRNAFIKLFQSPELRRKMGEEGRKRAIEVFEWRNIIRRYEALWRSMSSLRKEESTNLKACSYQWPSRLDPFYSFSKYPSKQLNSQTRVSLIDKDCDDAFLRFQKLYKLSMINYTKDILPTQSEVRQILQLATKGPHKALDLIKSFSQSRQPFVFRGISWLLKLGILIEQD